MKIRSRPRRTLVIAAVACWLCAAAGRGQSGSMFLLDLPGDAVAVRYSPGSLERAVQVQDTFESIVEDFRSWSKSKVVLVILLLGRDEWKESALDRPYGIAEWAGGRGLAMPAWGDDGTVELWRKHLGSRLPTLDDQPLRGTPEQAASLAVADLIGSVDAARILLRAGGITTDEPWVGDVLAHAIVLNAIEEDHKERLSDVRLVFDDLDRTGGGAGAFPLSALGASPSMTANLWFESQFFAAADLLVGQGGKFPIKAIFKQARKNGGRITAADLLAKCPELGSWQRSRFAAE